MLISKLHFLVLVPMIFGGYGEKVRKKCFDKPLEQFGSIKKEEKDIPIRFGMEQEATGRILSRMMQIYLGEVLGFQNITVGYPTHSVVNVKMVDWISFKPKDTYLGVPDHLSDYPLIELIGFNSWFVPHRFSEYNHWKMFGNPSFAVHHPVNSSALSMIENLAIDSTVQEQCRTCTIILTEEPSEKLIETIADHGLYIQAYNVGSHLARVVSSLLKSYPAMFFILVHRYPSEITYSRDKFTSIETPGAESSTNEYRRLSAERKKPFFPLYRTMNSSGVEFPTPTLVRVMKNAHLSTREYLQLLESFGDRSDEYDVACDWLKENANRSLRWIEEPQESVSIGILLPTELEVFSEASVFEIMRQVREAINENEFPVNFQLVLVNVIYPCSVSTQKYFIRPVDLVRMIGIVGPPCYRPKESVKHWAGSDGPVLISYIQRTEPLKSKWFWTMGPVETYLAIHSKFLVHFDWRRVAVIAETREDIPEFLLELNTVFRGGNINVLSVLTIPKQWGFEDTKQSLSDIVGKKVKIIIVDESIKSLRAIVCAAFHLNITARRGYVWCFSGLSHDDLWKKKFVFQDGEVSCSPSDLFQVVNGHFNVAQRYFRPGEEITQSLGKYAGFLYDACWTFIDAYNRLEEKIVDNGTGEKFAEILSKTDFVGKSGRVRFNDDRSRITDYRIQQFINDSYVTVATFDSMLTVRNSSIVWVMDFIPNDGGDEEFPAGPDCIFQSVTEVFDVSCDDAHYIVIVIVLVLSAFPIAVCFIVYKKKYDKEARIRESLLKSRNKMLPVTYDLAGLEMKRNGIVMGLKIGEGAFGNVYSGDVLLPDVGSIPVAVKTLKPRSSVLETSDFLSEIEAMRNFDHPNLVKLLGICTKSEPILTVMEFMVNGDLKSYLQTRKEMVDEIGCAGLTGMALDVIKALNYMKQLGYVHRDVAARNCLINSEMVVKLGDFGLTRSVSENHYYRFSRKGLFPVRWMAVESLNSGVFTSASDIWSFGILIYEMITFGRTPYHDKTNEQVIQYLRAGETLSIPTAVKPKLRDLMESCWTSDADERLTALEIIGILEADRGLVEPYLEEECPEEDPI